MRRRMAQVAWCMVHAWRVRWAYMYTMRHAPCAMHGEELHEAGTCIAHDTCNSNCMVAWHHGNLGMLHGT